MKELEKSLRVFFMIIALLLFSQVLGTGLDSSNYWLLAFSAVIILSGIVGLIKNLEKIVLVLDITILIGMIISWAILHGAWPLYLMYLVYGVVQAWMNWYWMKQCKEDNEEDAS